MMEDQSQRIKRLGNRDHIWYGQSSFFLPIVFPCHENVVLPASFALINFCQKCGLPLKERNEGTLQYGALAVIKHTSDSSCATYHEECIDRSIPFVHELERQEQKAIEDSAGQLSLFDL